MDEIELKLQLSPASADQVKASEALPRTWRTVQQRAIYFDTKDRTLAAAGMSLRIRESEDQRVQTIKAPGRSAGGLFSRSEWERPVSANNPVIDETTPVQALLAQAGELMRAFEVEVSRRIWDFTDGDTRIEVVLDRGTVSAGDRQTPVCELELELKAGSPQALFDLARTLDGEAAARLGVLTKSERGERLAQALSPAVKAGPVSLAPDMTAAEAFQAILQACIKHFRVNEDLLFPARAPEALHQARVALRRMRSAFSIFGPLLGTDAARDLRDRLRQLAAELGQARDLDVLLQRAQPGPLRDRLRTEREAAYDRVEEVLEAAATRGLMLDVTEWASSGPWLGEPDHEKDRNLSARAFAAHALKRFRRKVKKGGKDLAHLEDEARHELRKDAKKLRYAAEFFAPLFDGKRESVRQKAFMAALEDVQDHLGALNDLATAPQVLDRLGIADEPEASALLAGGKKKALLAQAAEAHGDLVDAARYWR
ncbi:MAG: inorganic triphosphatase [Alphaproteobacteria bacterium]|nr:inorganic triphosphatase [Alphaproteobacteria bacterium]